MRDSPTRTTVRLQKAMADAGVGARRDCEEMIAAGRVRVNGKTVTSLPCFVDPSRDVVELDGEVIELPLDTARADKAAHARSPIERPSP